MKKTILAGTIAATCLTITACDSQKGTDVLAYVPAQTALFFGEFEPVSMKKKLASNLRQLQSPTLDKAITELKQNMETSQGGQRFALTLLLQTLTSLKNPDDFLTALGLPDKGQSYFYTLGALPVLKMEIEDPAAFWSFLDKAEQASVYTHTIKKLQGVEYRSYNILKHEAAKSGLDVAILVKDGMATITLDTATDNSLAIAFGLEKPSTSLAQTGKIDDLIKTFELSGQTVGFINHVALIDALTKKESNRLGKQIAMLIQQLANPSFDAILQMLQSKSCASELGSIAANWPQTVFAYDYQVDGDHVSTHGQMIVDSKNQAMLASLNQIQGYVPKYVTQPSALSMGIGLDANKLASGLNGVIKELISPQFNCPVLAGVQSQIASTDTSLLAMAGMISGLKGLSFGLFDYDLEFSDWGSPAQFTLDGLFTISASDPMALYNLVNNFQPALQQMVPINEDGTPTNLSDMMSEFDSRLSSDLYVVLRNNHIVFYSGAQGQKVADALTKESVEKNNALFALSVDYDTLMTPALKAAKAKNIEIPEELKIVKDYQGKGSAELKITPRGIEIGTKMQF